MEVDSLKEGESSSRRWPVSRRENGHVTEVVTNGGKMVILYGGGQFSGGRMVMLQRWSL